MRITILMTAIAALGLQGCDPEYACIMREARKCPEAADSSATLSGGPAYGCSDTLSVKDTLVAPRP